MKSISSRMMPYIAESKVLSQFNTGCVRLERGPDEGFRPKSGEPRAVSALELVVTLCNP